MTNTMRRVKAVTKGSGNLTGVKKQKNSKIQFKRKKTTAIKSKEAYQAVMKEIDQLMKRGETNLRPAELERLGKLAEAAEKFEDTHDPLPLPESLPDIIRMRMFQLQLNQGFAAALLGVSNAKFSLIMNGKQKPDIYFLKAIHEKLKVDANKILQAL